MGLRAPTGLDNAREDNLGQTIRELKERIGHLKTYTEQDTGLLELQLEGLIEQHNKEINNG